MTTRELSQHLAAAAKCFPLLGMITEDSLADLVRCELGSSAVLDEFQPHGAHRAKAAGPRTILHIIGGNTPHAGLQSLLRGLLLKSHNLCKIPSSGLPEIAQFRDKLPRELRGRVEIADTLPADWMARADAVVVYGSDETVEKIRGMTRPGQIFIAHGHKVSLGVIFEDPRLESARLAARDVSLFDQQGCLSPHAFYVREAGGLAASHYAAQLAEEMAAFNLTEPRGEISPAETQAIEQVRRDYEFRAANDQRVKVWASPGSTAWTVICDPDSNFTASCLNRVVFVKPLPADFAAALAGVRPHLSTIAIWPATANNVALVTGLGASRICAAGEMQSPPLTWHQDGIAPLAALVRWVDVES